MPRLIPRLIQKLEQSGLENVERRRNGLPLLHRKRRKLFYESALPTPDFSSSARNESILLDENNSIIRPLEYARHKSPPPSLHPRKGKAKLVNYKQMTEEERSWHANPYLRMLSSPIRTCLASSRHLPNDFLIRLCVKRVPVTKGRAMQLLPDGIEHPKFKSLRSGKAMWVTCWKEAVNALEDKGSYKRFAPLVRMSSRFAQHVGHLLRVRVLQELELLAEQLRNHSKTSSGCVLRKLTRAEFQLIRETGTIPYPDAAAIIVVPPINRDPVTKMRPAPSKDTTFDPQILAESPAPKRPSLPPYLLHSASEISLETEDEPPLVPDARVPLYNAASFFPFKVQRAALHEGLNKLLALERPKPPPEVGRPSDGERNSDSKASHAYLLSSNAQSVLRADTVPLAIALWRVRMWEGGGWAHTSKRGWVIRRWK